MGELNGMLLEMESNLRKWTEQRDELTRLITLTTISYYLHKSQTDTEETDRVTVKVEPNGIRKVKIKREEPFDPESVNSCTPIEDLMKAAVRFGDSSVIRDDDPESRKRRKPLVSKRRLSESNEDDHKSNSKRSGYGKGRDSTASARKCTNCERKSCDKDDDCAQNMKKVRCNLCSKLEHFMVNCPSRCRSCYGVEYHKKINCRKGRNRH
jgi:hypothetical protein